MTYEQMMKDEYGYECITTYWDDFSIADAFGINAIKDTFKRALLNTEYKMITELYMVLNHKLWNHYNAGREQIARVYDELWRKCGAYADEHFSKDELSYFYRVTD